MTVWRCAMVSLAALVAGATRADDFAAERQQVLALAKLTVAPAMQNADGFDATGAVKAIYYDALPWQGKPTKVFAWLGLPAERQGTVPGVVLVHGGGGTAFKLWVEKWNAKGFAAISIAVEGQTDVQDELQPGAKRRGWQRHPDGGPARPGIYGDSAEPLADQWMYHAVADTILANSLLRSLPEVDADKVGIMGISWGGVITSTVIGIDQRFAFAIPVYGCGHLADVPNQYGRALGKNALYRQVWDPMVRLDGATMPALWFSWPQDNHFPMDSLAASCRAAPGPRMICLVSNMGHGHGPPWNRPESYAFAQSIVQTGRPWCTQTKVTAAANRAIVSFAADRPLDNAVLILTTDTGITGNRNWIESPATLKHIGAEWRADAALPAGTTAWFINVHASDLIASSEYQEAAPQ